MFPGSQFTPANDKAMHFSAALHPADLGCVDGDEPDVRKNHSHLQIGAALAYSASSTLDTRMQAVPFARKMEVMRSWSGVLVLAIGAQPKNINEVIRGSR